MNNLLRKKFFFFGFFIAFAGENAILIHLMHFADNHLIISKIFKIVVVFRSLCDFFLGFNGKWFFFFALFFSTIVLLNKILLAAIYRKGYSADFIHFSASFFVWIEQRDKKLCVLVIPVTISISERITFLY